MTPVVQTERYTPVGDILVLTVCYVMLILLFFSFKVRNKSFKVFLSLLTTLIAAAFANIIFHYLYASRPGTPLALLYALRCFYHALLFFMMYQYVAYICLVTGLSMEEKKPYHAIAGILLITVVAADVLKTFTGGGIQLNDGNISARGHSVFMIGYALYVLLICVLMFHVRHHLYKRMMYAFYCTVVISVAMLAGAKMAGQESFTVSTYLLPVISIMYLLHSSPYDAQLGANDIQGLNALIRYSGERNKTYLYLSLYLRELDEAGKPIPAEIQATARRFAAKFFRAAVMFRAGNGHLLLMARKNRNPDYEARIEAILRAFRQEYDHFRLDYKIIIGQTTEELSRQNEYVSFIRSIHTRIPENTIYRVQPDDIIKFRKYERILNELADIAAKKDPEDPRVLVYCQPVLNTRSGRYDTAEALMRLQLEGEGIVYPDQFISLAEDNGYIHALTQIILHKVCRSVRNLEKEGYEIDRISVNVSAVELRDQLFCTDIRNIIEESGIQGSRIAIELTESRNEQDFLLMKEKIGELKENGITFYLDDFGTGYSNMERILELPFDIIKFDRSMVTAGTHSKRSEQVLGSLADLFSRLDYAVLFEGVETERDEEMCRELFATYLQGYKYSKPIPIDRLREFLERETEP